MKGHRLEFASTKTIDGKQEIIKTGTQWQCIEYLNMFDVLVF
jgi:hypothetical protein